MGERVVAEAFPPGEYLRDELEARGWTQEEFAEIIGRSEAAVNRIINAKASITPETAKLFEAALSTSAMLWINLEAAYQFWLKGPAPARVAIAAKLRARWPVRDMVKRGWVEHSKDPDELEARVCEFFEIDELDDDPVFSHAAKKTKGPANYGELAEIQWAWLLRVKRIAETMHVPKYSEKRVREALPELMALRGDPEEIRHVPKILEDCGVRLVIVEPLPGSKIDGVCFWLAAQEPVIGLSLRLGRIDNFWFCLRHEIEHVLQRHAHADSDMEKADAGAGGDDQERVANRAAANFCVPTDEMDDWVRRVQPLFSNHRVVGFAALVGVHPGLVVGQLHKRTERYDLLRKFLIDIRGYLTPYALTDGYGQMLPT